KVLVHDKRLHFEVMFKNKPVIERSPLRFTLDGVDLTEGVELGKAATYRVNETYPWLGGHSQGTNHCNGAKFPVKHQSGSTNSTLEVRAFNDAVAFRFLVPGKDQSRVPDEATTFVLPAGSTVWYHDLEGHYEGVHAKKGIAEAKAG